MDPTNNPTPNPNSVPGMGGAPATPNPAPAAPIAPEPVAPAAPAAPVPAPTPAAPAPAVPAPVAPAPAPAPAAPAMPEAPAAPAPEPAAPVQGAAAASPIVNQNPVNPVFQPSGQTISATDPIMMPEPAKAPDPVEEELNAPMKAAAPVPGSIGSAVSGPEDGKTADGGALDDIFKKPSGGKTQSVSFNDPASQPDAAQNGKPGKKKTSKGTLIALIVVFVIIAGVLAVVLLGQIGVLDFGNLFGGGSSTDNEVVVVDEDINNPTELIDEDDETEGAETTTGKSSFLNCSRDMTETELLSYGDVLSGSIEVDTEFSNGKLISIELTKEITTNEVDNETGDFVVEEKEALSSTVDGITTSNAKDYYLTAGTDGTIDFSKAAIQKNYESLDFTCKTL